MCGGSLRVLLHDCTPGRLPLLNLAHQRDPGQACSGRPQRQLVLKFRSSAGGYITGVRFYRGSTGGGPFVAKLWFRRLLSGHAARHGNSLAR